MFQLTGKDDQSPLRVFELLLGLVLLPFCVLDLVVEQGHFLLEFPGDVVALVFQVVVFLLEIVDELVVFGAFGLVLGLELVEFLLEEFVLGGDLILQVLVFGFLQTESLLLVLQLLLEGRELLPEVRLHLRVLLFHRLHLRLVPD